MRTGVRRMNQRDHMKGFRQFLEALTMGDDEKQLFERMERVEGARDRAVIELGELNAKLGKLESFIETGNFELLDEEDRSLLKCQSLIMAAYAQILDRRISRLTRLLETCK